MNKERPDIPEKWYIFQLGEKNGYFPTRQRAFHALCSRTERSSNSKHLFKQRILIYRKRVCVNTSF